MGEERGFSRSGGKSFSGGHGKFGGHRNGAKSGSAERHGGFHKDGFHKGGFHKDGFKRDGVKHDGFKKDSFRKDGDRRDFDRNEDRRGDFKKSFHKDGFHKDGFKRDGMKRDGFKKDGDRFDRRDNRREDFRDNRRFNHGEERGENNRFERNNDYRSRNENRNSEGGNPRYKKFDDNRFNHKDDRHDNRKPRRDGFHKDGVKHEGFKRDGFKKDGDRFDRRDNRNERRNFSYENGPRRNSDGTISYPSQNPYTARRPGEPKMPKGLEYSMLSKESRERLRGLSKEHSENIGLHILAAYALEEEDPKLALEHAQWAAKQASRIDFSRETLAFIAYRQGDYKLAAREFRTAMRMNGYLDYLPFIADCERGMGNLDKALEICMSDDAKSVVGEVKAELFLVYAGVLADTNRIDKAIELVHVMGRSKGLPGEYRMRAIQAEQYFLEEAGRSDEAIELEGLLDRLEEQYADSDDEEINPEDIVIDYDLEHFNDSLLEDIGVSEEDAKYAPEDAPEYDSEDSDEDSDEDSSEDSSEEDADTSSSEVDLDSEDTLDSADNTETIEMNAVNASEE